MAITRTYGDITSALSLAQDAGRNDAFRWQFGADEQHQAQLDQEQQMRNNQANSEITNSLHEQQLNQQNSQFYANQDLEGQRLAASSGYQQGQLANQQQQTKQQGDYQQGSLGIQQQTADTQESRESAYEKAVQGQAAKNQGMGNYYQNKADNVQIDRSSPYAPGNPAFDAADKTIHMLQSQLQIAQAAQHSKEIYGTPVNANDPSYQQATQQTKDLQQKINMLTQAHLNSMQGGQQQLMPNPQGGGAPPAPVQQVPPQQQPQQPGVGQGQGTTVQIGSVPVPLPAAPPALQPPQQNAPLSQYPQVQQQLLKLYMDKVTQNVPPAQRTPQALDQGYIQYVQSLGWRLQ